VAKIAGAEQAHRTIGVDADRAEAGVTEGHRQPGFRIKAECLAGEVADHVAMADQQLAARLAGRRLELCREQAIELFGASLQRFRRAVGGIAGPVRRRRAFGEIVERRHRRFVQTLHHHARRVLCALQRADPHRVEVRFTREAGAQQLRLRDAERRQPRSKLRIRLGVKLVVPMSRQHDDLGGGRLRLFSGCRQGQHTDQHADARTQPPSRSTHRTPRRHSICRSTLSRKRRA